MRRLAKSQHGLSTVELAIFLPLLLILVMGVIDVGRTLYTLIAIQEAAQEGALYGSFQPADATVVQQRVVRSVDDPVLTTGDVTVACPGGPSGGVIAVTAEHDLTLLTPIFGDWLGGQIRLARTVSGDIYSADACDPS